MIPLKRDLEIRVGVQGSSVEMKLEVGVRRVVLRVAGVTGPTNELTGLNRGAFLDAGPISGGRGAIMTAELLAACRLCDAGLDRMVGADPSLIPSSELMEEFRAAWLGSSRPGGLDDSIAKLTGP